MPLDGRELTISVQQSYLSAGTITSPVGGSWPAGTYSFKVVAWYTNGEALEDNAGVIRTNVAAWAGHVVAANDQVIITWTAANRVPDHYSVYYIEAGSWVANGTIRGRKIAEVEGDVLTATILKPFVQQGSSTNFASTTTGPNSNTELIDTAADFVSNNMKEDDSVSNVDAAFTTTIDTVDDLNTLTVDDGGTFTTGNNYRITSTTALEDTAATFVTNGVVVGDYVILNAGASTVGAYAKVLEVVSETVLRTAALSDSASYTLADSYDVVNGIFVISTDATSFTINPVRDIPFTLRTMMVKAYNGLMVTKSYAQASPFDESSFVIDLISITETNYKKVCIWIYQGVRVRITESTDASALVPTRDGYFVGASLMPTRYKNSNPTITLNFADETGSLT